jgi:putative thymidine phosphorylase
MKLKVKDLDIATGGVRIAVLNYLDAEELDIHHLDRIKIKKGKKFCIAVVDISESEKFFKKGNIGLMEEVLADLKAVDGDDVEIRLEKKPKSVIYIKEKLEGKKLDYDKIYSIVNDISLNRLTDIEMTTFVTSYYVHKSNMEEIADLTNAMIKTGQKLDFGKKIVVDLHSVGGVPNNRTTMIVVPIIVAAGYAFPKTSSRSITSPAGTADTMEVLCDVKISVPRLKKIMKKVGGFLIWGGSVNLAPADDKIIQIERPLNLDSPVQMAASIMAKKVSVGSTHLLLEIPVGRETKIKKMSQAMKLKKIFKTLGKRLGIKVRTVITNGNEPVGNGIGPILEVKDVLYILKNDARGPSDLKNKSLLLAGDILEFIGVGKKSRQMAKEILESGLAYKSFMDIVKAQGGKEVDPDELKPGKFSYDFLSERDGYLSGYDNIHLARVARFAGAPRDKSAGVFLYKKAGNRVKKKEKILTIYSNNKVKLEHAVDLIKEGKTVILRSSRNKK